MRNAALVQLEEQALSQPWGPRVADRLGEYIWSIDGFLDYAIFSALALGTPRDLHQTHLFRILVVADTWTDGPIEKMFRIESCDVPTREEYIQDQEREGGEFHGERARRLLAKWDWAREQIKDEEVRVGVICWAKVLDRGEQASYAVYDYNSLHHNVTYRARNAFGGLHIDKAWLAHLLLDVEHRDELTQLEYNGIAMFRLSHSEEESLEFEAQVFMMKAFGSPSVDANRRRDANTKKKARKLRSKAAKAPAGDDDESWVDVES
ncbi:hypothetical protein RQP46_002921 [Phenoliferia psychrophenolica]